MRIIKFNNPSYVQTNSKHISNVKPETGRDAAVHPLPQLPDILPCGQDVNSAVWKRPYPPHLFLRLSESRILKQLQSTCCLLLATNNYIGNPIFTCLTSPQTTHLDFAASSAAHSPFTGDVVGGSEDQAASNAGDD